MNALVNIETITAEKLFAPGEISYSRIREAAKKFPRADVVRIWNAVVDTKLVPDAREPFYWKEPAGVTP